MLYLLHKKRNKMNVNDECIVIDNESDYHNNRGKIFYIFKAEAYGRNKKNELRELAILDILYLDNQPLPNKVLFETRYLKSDNVHIYSKLRVGNFHHSEEIHVNGMHSVLINGKAYATITDYGIIMYHKGLIAFEPIVLCESWLLALGFKKYENHYYGLSFYNSKLEGEFIWIDNDMKVLGYPEISKVHEIQNFYEHKSGLKLTTNNQPKTKEEELSAEVENLKKKIAELDKRIERLSISKANNVIRLKGGTS